MPERTIYTELHWYDGIKSIQRRDGKGNADTLMAAFITVRVFMSWAIFIRTEGFWSRIKRDVGGVYDSVSQKYLQSYLDEYSWRYNRRDQANWIFKSIFEAGYGAGVVTSFCKEALKSLLEIPGDSRRRARISSEGLNGSGFVTGSGFDFILIQGYRELGTMSGPKRPKQYSRSPLHSDTVLPANGRSAVQRPTSNREALFF